MNGRPARWVTFSKRERLLNTLAAIVILLILAAFMVPVYSGNGVTPRYACLSSLKQVGLATAIYNNDFDDRFPPSKA